MVALRVKDKVGTIEMGQAGLLTRMSSLARFCGNGELTTMIEGNKTDEQLTKKLLLLHNQEHLRSWWVPNRLYQLQMWKIMTLAQFLGLSQFFQRPSSEGEAGFP